MFFFGDPSAIADTYLEKAILGSTGVVVDGTPLEEMPEKILSGYIVYFRLAYKRAKKDEAPQEVLDELMRRYDEVFVVYAAKSQAFRDLLPTGRHEWLGGYTIENKQKYLRLAGLSSAN
jgi:hypothetical protein